MICTHIGQDSPVSLDLHPSESKIKEATGTTAENTDGRYKARLRCECSETDRGNLVNKDWRKLRAVAAED